MPRKKTPNAQKYGRRVPAPQNYTLLTEREKEVIEKLRAGATNKEIATTFKLSIRTVEQHLLNSYKKLGVNSRASALLMLMKMEG